MGVNGHLGKITKRDRESLNQLVLDCNMYRLTENESLKYIESRFGKRISGRTYRRYKRNLDNGNELQEWINYFSTIGDVLLCQQLLNASKSILESSLRRLLQEENKEKQDDYLVLRLKDDIRQDIKIAGWISDSMPIVARTRDLIETFKKKAVQNEQERPMLPGGVRLCP